MTHYTQQRTNNPEKPQTARKYRTRGCFSFSEAAAKLRTERGSECEADVTEETRVPELPSVPGADICATPPERPFQPVLTRSALRDAMTVTAASPASPAPATYGTETPTSNSTPAPAGPAILANALAD